MAVVPTRLNDCETKRSGTTVAGIVSQCHTAQRQLCRSVLDRNTKTGRHLFAGQLCACFGFRHLKYTCSFGSFTLGFKDTPWPSTLQHADNDQFLALYKLSQSSIRTCASTNMPAASLFAFASP
ncbi:hypothetical protein INS49_002266 [Diaporthe citri]|uniref:uncharacterized protein n=1 Tax=Diaporthe citri TaxID=83186 RepID=UPI001C8146B5|nr:uncharacterized protein INS49_002266 [Diaporthe citri]KAG6368066.1 hypothetical protein INS49_002266 [Diaporthe citri]